jgi:hypothetical protein
MRKFTIAQMATVLGVSKTEIYGLVRFLEAKGVFKKNGSVKADPSKRGRAESLYEITLETPVLAAFALEPLLDQANASVSDANQLPQLAEAAPVAVEPEVSVVTTAGEVPVEIIEQDRTLPGIGPVFLG